MPQDERDALLAELAEENAAKPEAKVGPLKVLGNPKVWFLCAIYFSIQISVYGITFYLPTQVASFLGMKVGLLVGLVSAIPWVCALLAAATIPKYSDRSGKRGILAAFLMICCGIGIMISAVHAPVLGIAGLCIASAGFYSAQPIFWTMPSRFLSGVGVASAIAFINSVGNLGGFVAPNLRVFAEKFFQNSSAGLLAIGVASFVGALLFLISIPLGIGENTSKLSK
jgi:MFS family permease